MKMKTQQVIGSVFVMCAAMGCAAGEPPTIQDLALASPVVRGQAANGSLSVADPDGLAGLELEARIEGPTASPVPFAEPSFTDEQTEAPLAFVLLLSDAAPTGTYTLFVEAVDVDEMRSEEASVQFQVE